MVCDTVDDCNDWDFDSIFDCKEDYFGTKRCMEMFDNDGYYGAGGFPWK